MAGEQYRVRYCGNLIVYCVLPVESALSSVTTGWQKSAMVQRHRIAIHEVFIININRGGLN